MDTYKTRENLKRRIIEAFASEEEIYHIHLFGREAEAVVTVIPTSIW